MPKTQCILHAAVVVALSVAASARADIATFVANRDNTLYEDPAGGFSNGAGQFMFAGNTAVSLRRRALVGFDVASGIPSGSVVTSATLTLRMTRSISGAENISLHRVLADWGQGTSNAGGSELGTGGGGGAASTANDATWIHRFFNTQLWTAPGGDFDPTPSGSTLVDAAQMFYTWNSTPQMVADVQGWVDTPANSYGWMLIGNEGTPTTAKRFDTLENVNVSFRPMLTVEYIPADQVPTASQWGMTTLVLLLLSAGTIVFARRRGRASDGALANA